MLLFRYRGPTCKQLSCEPAMTRPTRSVFDRAWFLRTSIVRERNSGRRSDAVLVHSSALRRNRGAMSRRCCFVTVTNEHNMSINGSDRPYSILTNQDQRDTCQRRVRTVTKLRRGDDTLRLRGGAYEYTSSRSRRPPLYFPRCNWGVPSPSHVLLFVLSCHQRHILNLLHRFQLLCSHFRVKAT